MEKFYWLSSDGKVHELTDDLYHWGWKKKDVKYIKRERKNGKWVYTYPDDNENKTSKKPFDLFGIRAKKDEEKAKQKSEDTYKRLQEYVKTASSRYDKARDDASADKYVTEREKVNVTRAKILKDDADRKMEKANKERATDTESHKPRAELKFIDEMEEYFKAEEEKDRSKRYEASVSETAAANKLTRKFSDAIAKLKESNPFPGLSLKKRPYTTEQDALSVNPNYSFFGSYDENCALCTMAYDLRKRGYDVEAMPEEATQNSADDPKGLFMDDIRAVYDIPKEDVIKPSGRNLEDAIADRDNISVEETMRNLDEFKTKVIEYGEGARGNLGVYWRSGGGHSVSWEVENGDVVIRDTQTMGTYTLEDYSSKIFYFEAIRTDDRQPNDKILKYVRNRGE